MRLSVATLLTVEICKFGNGNCIGDGAVCYDLYYGGVHVGEQIISNGTRYEEESGDVIQTRLNYKFVEDIPQSNVVCCEYCGEELYTVDDQYEAEWPNSSSMYYSQQREQHDEHCVEYNYTQELWESDVQKWLVENSIILPEFGMDNIIDLVIEQGKCPIGLPCPPSKMYDYGMNSRAWGEELNTQDWVEYIESHDWDRKYLFVRVGK